MLSFELTAIDLILVIAVFVLLILYMTKLANSTEQVLKRSLEKDMRAHAHRQERVESMPQMSHAQVGKQCPRGFGNIRILGDDGSVAEKCLGCYKIMDCYSGNVENEF